MMSFLQALLFLAGGVWLLGLARQGIRLGLMPSWTHCFGGHDDYSRGVQPLSFWGMGAVYGGLGVWMMLQAYGLTLGT